MANTLPTSLLQGRVLHYPLNEGRSDENYSTSGSHILTITNHETPWKLPRDKANPNCFESDGVDSQSKNTDISALGIGTTFTIAITVKEDNETGASRIAEFTNTNGKRCGLGNQRSSHKNYFMYNGKYAVTSLGYSTGWSLWRHLCGTYDGTTAAFYINGIIRPLVAPIGDYNGVANNLVVGRTAADPPVYSSQSHNDLMIWNRKLEPSEVARLSATMMGRFIDIDSGKESQWKVKESSGSSVSNSGSNGTALTILGHTDPDDFIIGDTENSLLLDGVDAEGDAGDIHDFERTNKFSIIVTFKTDSSSTDLEPLVTKTTTDRKGYELLYKPSDGSIVVNLNNHVTDNYQSVSASGTAADGLRHQIGFTYDGSSTGAGITIYEDGQALTPTIDVDILTLTILHDAAFQVGSSDELARFFDCTIDDVQVYANRELSATVMQELWDQLGEDTFGGIIAQYNYGERTGTSTRDLSKTPKDLVIINGDATTSWVSGSGPDDSGVDLDGVNEYLIVDADDDKFSRGDASTDQPFTLWGIIRKKGGSSEFPIFCKAESSGGTGLEYIFTFQNTSSLYVKCMDNSFTINIMLRYTGAIEEDVITFFVATYNGNGLNTGLEIYIGKAKLTSDLARTFQGGYVAMHNTTVKPTMGVWNLVSGPSYGKGQIYAGGMFDRVLNEAEIGKLYDKYFGVDIGTDEVLHLPMIEGTGTTTRDFTKLASDATLIDTPTWTTGPNNFNALQFNGTTERGDLGTGIIAALLHGASAMSLSCWVWVIAHPGSGNDHIFKCHMTGTNAGLDLYLEKDTDSYITCSARSQNGDSTQKVRIKTSTTGRWHFINLNVDIANAQMDLYFDNKLVDSQAVTFGSSTFVDPNDQSNVDSLAAAAAADFANVKIADLRVYKRLITRVQREKLLNLGVPTV